MDIADIYRYFPDQSDCVAYMESVRWGDKPQCPYCGSQKSTPAPKERRHHCNGCNRSYSVTVGTIMHRSKIDLRKWLYAIGLMMASKKMTVRDFADKIEANNNTAVLMRKKLKLLTHGHNSLWIYEATVRLKILIDEQKINKKNVKNIR